MKEWKKFATEYYPGAVEFARDIRQTIISLPRLPQLIREQLSDPNVRGSLIYETIVHPLAGGIGGYYLLRDDLPTSAKIAVGVGLGLSAVLIGINRRQRINPDSY